MAAGGADLFFDQIQVIEQPFRSRGDAVFRHHRLGQLATGLDQYRFVGIKSRQQLVRLTLDRQAMHVGQSGAVLRHLVGAE